MTPTSPVEAAARTGRDPQAAPLGVPWPTVLALAVPLSFADGFWLTSVRGAVGSTGSVEAPFATWLRGSTLAVPFYVLAVLVALHLALIRLGPVLRARTVLSAAALVALAATLMGAALLAAWTAFEYHLQVEHLELMSSLMGSCVGDCLVQQQHAALVLLVRAGGYGVVIMLVTNVVLVAWVLALRGGRLDVARARESRFGRTGEPRSSGRYPRDLRDLVAAALVGTAVIHGAVVPAHLAEWAAAGWFFVLLAAAEVAVAGLLLTRPRRWLPGAVAVVSLGPLLLWGCSRTVGIPFGPEAGVAEPVGLADLAAVLLENLTLVGAYALYLARRRPTVPGSPYGRWQGLVAVVAVTALGLAGSGLAWVDIGVAGHHDDGAASVVG